jgi:tRNA pseudouridine(55) synthase
MEKIIVAKKEVGVSPFDLIKEIKKKNPILKKEKMAYAGRLDPIAKGLVLIVVGDELKNFNDYLRLDKEYKAKILFGFDSDTYDILGVAKREREIDEKKAESVLKKFVGSFSFDFPPFSSYKIKGKPLFWWAREERIDEIKVPEKKVEIYSLDVLKKEWISEKELKKEIISKIKKVKGDFRQEKIIKNWENILKKEKKHLVFSVNIFCSSGCYIRSVAKKAGEMLGSGAVLLDLQRTRVGDYKLDL